MAAYVDAKNAVVRDGDTAWPFDVDCRDGVAHISLDDNRYVVRPLAWREKRNLARFAHLGEHFLQTQFLRVSLNEGGDNLPTTEKSRSVLSALVRWINAPDGDFGLPLDQQLLATVTLDICRTLQLGPHMFNTLDANEVEMLWRAARSKQAPPADATTAATPGMTRIVVIPDNAPSSNERIDNDDAVGPAVPAFAFTAPEIDSGKISTVPLRPANSNAATTNSATATATISGGTATESTDQSSLHADPAHVYATNASSSMASGRQRSQSAASLPNRFRVDFSPLLTTVSTKQTVVHSEAAVATAPTLRSSPSAREDLSTMQQAFPSEHPTPTKVRWIKNPQQIAAALDPAPVSVPVSMPASVPVSMSPTNYPNSALHLADFSLPSVAATALQNAEALPQLVDHFIAEFGARLDEAALAAGIELEN